MLPTQNRDLDMKQFILFAAALTAMTASAQGETLTLVNEINFSNYRAIDFCKDGNECFYLTNSDDSNKNIYTIYDKNFSEITTVQDDAISNMQINYEGESTKFTQTLFNSDDEYEYIAAKQEHLNGYSVITRGFKIMQTNGNCIADINIPETYNSVYFYLWVIGDQRYLDLRISGSESNEQHYIYKIDSNASNKALTLVKSTKAYPNPVKQGEPFTISGLKNALGANIFVNNMNGTTVQSSVCNENDKAVINTDKLTSGNYLYSIINNGNTIASGKLIIK